MKKGIYDRSFEATLQNGIQIAVNVRRFLSLDLDEIGVIKYEITATLVINAQHCAALPRASMLTIIRLSIIMLSVFQPNYCQKHHRYRHGPQSIGSLSSPAPSALSPSLWSSPATRP